MAGTELHPAHCEKCGQAKWLPEVFKKMEAKSGNDDLKINFLLSENEELKKKNEELTTALQRQFIKD